MQGIIFGVNIVSNHVVLQPELEDHRYCTKHILRHCNAAFFSVKDSPLVCCLLNMFKLPLDSQTTPITCHFHISELSHVANEN